MDGCEGSASHIEPSDDFALEILGLISSLEVFCCGICAGAVGASFWAIGLKFSLRGDVGATAGPALLREKTECADTELLLLVLVKSVGLGRLAERREGPNGVVFTAGLVGTSAHGKGSCFWLLEVEGNEGSALEIEPSDDFALEIAGLISSLDVFCCGVCAGAAARSFCTAGLLISLSGEAAEGSCFLKEKTE